MRLPVVPASLAAAACLAFAACNTIESSPPSSPAAAKPVRSKAYTAADTLPVMPFRPPALVPGAIPARVRYHVADDATVTAAAARLQAALASGDPAIYGPMVMVHPGAWIYVRNDVDLELADAAQLDILDPNRMAQQIQSGGGLVGRIFRTPHAISLLAPEIAKLLREDGGFRLRALQSAEMAQWWPYIPFDIEEPTFVAESAGGHHRFVFQFSHDKILILDDLTGLPNAH